MRTVRFLFVLLSAASLMELPSAHKLVQAAIGSTRPSIDPQHALAIIVNRSNPVENLSLAELRKIFMGERSRWPSGHRVVVTMMESGHPERDAILREVYDMSENGYRDYFLRERYTGGAPTSPKTLSSSIILRKFVFNTPGAIGYLRASDVDDSVKVVSIDGRLPDELDYKLQIEKPAK
jgi:ABC-type phosphate transport system substrate-binding protein